MFYTNLGGQRLIRTLTEEVLDHRVMILLGSHVQRGEPILRLCIHRSTSLYQQLYNLLLSSWKKISVSRELFVSQITVSRCEISETLQASERSKCLFKIIHVLVPYTFNERQGTRRDEDEKEKRRQRDENVCTLTKRSYMQCRVSLFGSGIHNRAAI